MGSGSVGGSGIYYHSYDAKTKIFTAIINTLCSFLHIHRQRTHFQPVLICEPANVGHWPGVLMNKNVSNEWEQVSHYETASERLSFLEFYKQVTMQAFLYAFELFPLQGGKGGGAVLNCIKMQMDTPTTKISNRQSRGKKRGKSKILLHFLHRPWNCTFKHLSCHLSAGIPWASTPVTGNINTRDSVCFSLMPYYLSHVLYKLITA